MSIQSAPGWWSRNWKWALPVSLVSVPVMACLLPSLVIGWVVQPRLTAFEQVVKHRVETDPGIASYLGGTPRVTARVAVNMKSSFLSGDPAVIAFQVPVAGPNGIGKVAGNGRETEEGIEISQISLHLSGGRPVELRPGNAAR